MYQITDTITRNNTIRDNTIRDNATHDNTAGLNDTAKPRIPEISGSLNIKTPDNIPFQLTRYGIYIYAANRE
jgi:hypothetical protein